jgi:hypothetical protein
MELTMKRVVSTKALALKAHHAQSISEPMRSEHGAQMLEMIQQTHMSWLSSFLLAKMSLQHGKSLVR